MAAATETRIGLNAFEPATALPEVHTALFVGPRGTGKLGIMHRLMCDLAERGAIGRAVAVGGFHDDVEDLQKCLPELAAVYRAGTEGVWEQVLPKDDPQTSDSVSTSPPPLIILKLPLVDWNESGEFKAMTHTILSASKQRGMCVWVVTESHVGLSPSEHVAFVDHVFLCRHNSVRDMKKYADLFGVPRGDVSGFKRAMAEGTEGYSCLVVQPGVDGVLQSARRYTPVEKTP